MSTIRDLLRSVENAIHERFQMIEEVVRATQPVPNPNATYAYVNTATVPAALNNEAEERIASLEDLVRAQAEQISRLGIAVAGLVQR